MSSANKFAPPVHINPNFLITLKALEYEAYRWGLAAHGKRPRYNNPISMAFGADLQRAAIDKYFAAIEQIIPKKTEGEPA